MKFFLTIFFFFISISVTADVETCALNKYKEYISLQNEAFSFASKKLEKEDPEAFKLIEQFPSYQKRYNDFKIYTGDLLLKNNPEMLNTDVVLRGLVPSLRNKQLIAYLIKTNDPVYKRDGEQLQEDTQHYLYGKGLGGFDGKEFEVFRKARGQLTERMKVAPTMPKLQKIGDLIGNQICN